MKIFQAKIVNDETPVRSPEPLKVGDVVRLKSGGPLMTVCNLSPFVTFFGVQGDQAHCTWFDYPDERGKVRDDFPLIVVNSGIFSTSCLDVYEPDSKGD